MFAHSNNRITNTFTIRPTAVSGLDLVLDKVKKDKHLDDLEVKTSEFILSFTAVNTKFVTFDLILKLN